MARTHSAGSLETQRTPGDSAPLRQNARYCILEHAAAARAKSVVINEVNQKLNSLSTGGTR